MRRSVLVSIVTPVAALAAAQLVPYGRDHSNPPVAAEPAWDSPKTRDLAARACFDCHSNETEWPWYSHVAPVSWLVQNDVVVGRSKLNWSEWNRPQDEADEAADSLRSGEMPIAAYRWIHPHAQLTATERADLESGLVRTFGGGEESGETAESSEPDEG